MEEGYFDVHKIVHLGQIFSQTFIFFGQNTFGVDGDTLCCFLQPLFRFRDYSLATKKQITPESDSFLSSIDTIYFP